MESYTRNLMEPHNILEISSRKELREWYEANHSTCKEFWIRVNRGKNEVTGVIPYVDSVEVALCFGWIDSTLKHIDDGFPFQRFSPRRKGCNWCERNIERCRKLVVLEEMTPSGLAVIPDNIKATF